jgi:hypothetical protein
MSDIVEARGTTWRIVRVLRRGQQPVRGNVVFTLIELSQMVGKPVPNCDMRLEYRRVK